MMKKGIVALDCDGVLLNYNAAYPKVWKKAFGEELLACKPGAYHASNEYGIELVAGTKREQFFSHFDDEAWSTMPAFPGALDASKALVKAGFTLVCVSSMPDQFAAARQRNLHALGFPIDLVIATGRIKGSNPKLETLRKLKPVAFVDDLVHNFAGVDWPMHKALIDRGQSDSPNRDEDLQSADSLHGSLSDFVEWWLN